ncbi:hypothetical protein K0M31_011744, partial [Melipona bicolor]
ETRYRLDFTDRPRGSPEVVHHDEDEDEDVNVDGGISAQLSQGGERTAASVERLRDQARIE